MILKRQFTALVLGLGALMTSCATNQPTYYPYQPSNSDYQNQDGGRPVAEDAPRTYFSPGDSRKVVEMVQGTPTSITGSDANQTWWYGSDFVEFRNGRVYNYTNLRGQLNVKIFPPSPDDGASSQSPPPFSEIQTPTGVGDGHYTDGTEVATGSTPSQEFRPVREIAIQEPQEVAPIATPLPRSSIPVYPSAVQTRPSLSAYGEISTTTGLPKTVPVSGYFRKDGTYVRPHYRSRR